MTRYEERGYCSLCQCWMKKKDLLKLYVKGVDRIVYYCPIHRKQVRMKARGTPMSTVKEVRK